MKLDKAHDQWVIPMKKNQGEERGTCVNLMVCWSKLKVVESIKGKPIVAEHGRNII